MRKDYGTRNKMMGGGMMKRKAMMRGSKPDFLDLDKDNNKTEAMKSAAASAKKMMKGGRVKKMGGGSMMKAGCKVGKKKENPMKEDRAKEGKKAKYRKMGFGKMMDKGEIKFAKGGSALKPVNPQTQKGLSKLPTEVRNKMGYMKKGGKVNGK